MARITLVFVSHNGGRNNPLFRVRSQLLSSDSAISHAQLRDALGVSFHEAEKLVKAHGAGHDMTI